MRWGNNLFLGGIMVKMAITVGLLTVVALMAGVPKPVVQWIPQVGVLLYLLWFFRWWRSL